MRPPRLRPPHPAHAQPRQALSLDRPGRLRGGPRDALRRPRVGAVERGQPLRALHPRAPGLPTRAGGAAHRPHVAQVDPRQAGRRDRLLHEEPLHEERQGRRGRPAEHRGDGQRLAQRAHRRGRVRRPERLRGRPAGRPLLRRRRDGPDHPARVPADAREPLPGRRPEPREHLAVPRRELAAAGLHAAPHRRRELEPRALQQGLPVVRAQPVEHEHGRRDAPLRGADALLEGQQLLPAGAGLRGAPQHDAVERAAAAPGAPAVHLGEHRRAGEPPGRRGVPRAERVPAGRPRRGPRRDLPRERQAPEPRGPRGGGQRRVRDHRAQPQLGALPADVLRAGRDAGRAHPAPREAPAEEEDR